MRARKISNYRYFSFSLTERDLGYLEFIVYLIGKSLRGFEDLILRLWSRGLVATRKCHKAQRQIFVGL